MEKSNTKVTLRVGSLVWKNVTRMAEMSSIRRVIVNRRVEVFSIRTVIPVRCSPARLFCPRLSVTIDKSFIVKHLIVVLMH